MKTGRKNPLGGFMAGLVTFQIVNNAMHLLQPLVIARLSGSLATAALVASLESSLSTTSTALTGGVVDKLGCRRALILFTALRGLSLAILPVSMLFGALTLPWALTGYVLDSIVRGGIDTAVHGLPMALADSDETEFGRLFSGYELAVDFAAIVGPLLLGVIMLKDHEGAAAHFAIPLGFLAAALLYSRIPDVKPTARAGEDHAGPSWLDFGGWKLVFSDKRILLTAAGLACFNLFGLRKVWSGLFAKGVLHDAAATGWIGAAFGLGGVAGALMFPRLQNRLTARGWVLVGSCGTAALATGWIPARLVPMLLGAAVFGLANACAELALLRRLGEDTPPTMAGRVSSVARLGTSGVSVTLKTGFASAFALGLTPYASFAVVGAGLGCIVLVQLIVASKLRRPSPQPDVVPAQAEPAAA